MQAFEFYQQMGDIYFKKATDPSGKFKIALGAAKLCFVFAAENALAIAKAFPDDTSEVKQKMMKAVDENFKLAKFIKDKIDNNPDCHARKMFMKRFEYNEQVIIEKTLTVKNRFLDLWQAHLGIIK